MAGITTSLTIFLLTFGCVIFLLVRLRFSRGDGISGLGSFLTGTIFILIAELWQTVKNIEAYSDWFLESAYPYLDMSQFLILLTGIVVTVIGLVLYADSWQVRRDELDQQEQKLSILGNLQHDSRQPYQLMELLNIALKEVVSAIPETTGAIFLVNRSRRQFVLTASIGLTKVETASLEYYPMERNIVSQSVDLGEPMIAGQFEFTDRSGTVTDSRFNSFLVLPMVSGMEKIGGIVLFAEKARFFSRNDIKYLAPSAEWMGEKIRSARLARELSISRKEADQYENFNTELVSRMITSVSACLSSEPAPEFCRSLVGLLGSQSVHLIGLVHGSLRFLYGSEPMLDPTENYKTALIDALDRNKPIILNQEAQTSEGQSYVATSTLVVSFPLNGNQHALMFNRENTAFKISDAEIKMIGVYTRLAGLLLSYNEAVRLDISRRKGFGKILQLLRFDSEPDQMPSPESFAELLSSVLPRKAKTITLIKTSEGILKGTAGIKTGEFDPARIEILPGEGELGLVSDQIMPTFAIGRRVVEQRLSAYETVNRDLFFELFGESGLPSFMAVCPLVSNEELTGAALFFVADISEPEAVEWEKMLTLATTLYSVRTTIDTLKQSKDITGVATASEHTLATANKLNNYLSVILGNAELGANRSDLAGEVRAHFMSIARETEKAAEYLKDSFTTKSDPKQSASEQTEPPVDLNEIVNNVLDRCRISENLFLIEGRTREINLKTSVAKGLTTAGKSITSLAKEVIDQFSTLTDESDIISISTYSDDYYAYLDISKHRKNFPPVERVVNFGQYQKPAEVLNIRPSDSYLKHLGEEDSGYSYDRHSPTPSYLSFKFSLNPKKVAGDKPSLANEKRILAIDDQRVILDLITAMCQSQGYKVDTAISGEEGLDLAAANRYDLVLTDLAMPGISGLEVASGIKRIYPDLPVILVTGWEVNVGKDQLDESGISAVLYKPFRIEQLIEIINSATISA